jgi:hypothetical protein
MKLQQLNALLFGALAFGFQAFAHEGHDMPGALPPPPHGGRVAQAAEIEADDHKGEEDHKGEAHDHEGEAKEDHKGEGKAAHAHGPDEAELFIEAKLSGDELSIYALELKEGSKTFKSISPSAELTIKEVEVEFPRSKRAEAPTAQVNGDHWATKVQMNKDRRFIAHVKMIQKGEEKLAKIQIEKIRQ